MCTVCGFQNGKAVFITRQPKDAYAKVSDPNPDDDNDPLSPINNQVSFQVSAFGKGELNYQWYRVKNDTNTKLADKEGLISGANENKLTVYVPTDACYETYDTASSSWTTRFPEGILYVHLYTGFVELCQDFVFEESDFNISGVYYV